MLPCPALWAEQSALAAGSGVLRVLFRLGGALQHCDLPGKPIKLQRIKQGSQGPGGSSSGSTHGQQQPLLPPTAARAYISARRHLQLYRLVISLFPTLEQVHQELTSSGAVELRGGATAGGSSSSGGGWVPPGPDSVWATPMPQVCAQAWHAASRFMSGSGS